MTNEQIEIPVVVRTEAGKSAARKLRNAGKVPAVVYGRGTEPISLTVDQQTFSALLPETAWYSTLIRLDIEGGDIDDRKPTVMIREVQRDLLQPELWSIDFRRVSLQEPIEASVPVIHVGHSPGVKIGGILDHMLHEVTVYCLPTEIPEHLEVDISGLEINDSIRVRDIVAPPNVEIRSREDDIVVLIAAPVKIEEVAPAVGEAAGAVVTETAEPEVLTERRSEEKTA